MDHHFEDWNILKPFIFSWLHWLWSLRSIQCNHFCWLSPLAFQTIYFKPTTTCSKLLGSLWYFIFPVQKPGLKHLARPAVDPPIFGEIHVLFLVTSGCVSPFWCSWKIFRCVWKWGILPVVASSIGTMMIIYENPLELGVPYFQTNPFFWGSIPAHFWATLSATRQLLSALGAVTRWQLRGAPDPGSSSSSSSKLSSICLAKVWNLGDHRKVPNWGPQKWSLKCLCCSTGKTT